MLKIFHIIASVKLGGAENVAFNLIEHLNSDYVGKFEFWVLELYSTNSRYAIEKKRELYEKGVKIITLGGRNKRGSLFYAPFFLVKQISSIKPHIIHSHTDLPDFVLGVATKLFHFNRFRIVRTIHNTALWPTHSFIGRFVESCFENDEVVAVSEAALQSYRVNRLKYGLSTSANSRIIYNGCSRINEKSPHPFNVRDDVVNIAFCGRFEYQKGIDILVDRMLSLSSDLRSKICFHIIGDGNLKTIVQRCLITDTNIFLYDTVIDLTKKLYDFDFVIMPSRFEGLPLLSIESSFAGVPVIAARSLGLTETLPPDWPLFFDLDNEQSLFEILEKITKGMYSRDKLSSTALEFAMEKFGLEKMASAYAALYMNKDTWNGSET